MSKVPNILEIEGNSARVKFCSGGEKKVRFLFEVKLEGIPYEQSGTYDFEQSRFNFSISMAERAQDVQDFIIQNGTEILKLCKQARKK